MNEINERLQKIYALVQNGGTEGEKAAAKNLLDKLMKKYNISDVELQSIGIKRYKFTYINRMEELLLIHIMKLFAPGSFESTTKNNRKQIYSSIMYIDYVEIDCRYEYYRRHMKVQWNRSCQPHVDRCRKAKTKAKMKIDLLPPFMTNYLIKSKLVKDEDLEERNELTDKEKAQIMIVQNVEGGIYNRQCDNKKLLENDTN